VNILLLGPQGSGKGTQAVRIAADYGLAHISTGDILRAAAEEGTPLGKVAKPIMDAGKLVPDDLIVGIIRERLGDEDTQDGFVLDGFPRNIAQADALDSMLREIERPLDVALELHLSDEICLERMAKRAELEGRADDTPETMRKRLAIYHADTEPLVEHYRARAALVVIHAERSVDEVFSEIQTTIETLRGR
jgi:adenylate kinase